MAAKLRKPFVGYGRGVGLSLPEDIILEVLLRLPAKALCQFQCVSRSWRALISDPAFVAALRSRATGTLIVAVFGDELRLLDKGGNVLMVFGIRGSKASLAPTRLDRIFVDRGLLGAMIINPASGIDFSIVGTNDPTPPWWAITDEMSNYSFGRAAASGDYKVVRLVASSYWHGMLGLWCEVATIGDGGGEPTWRQRPRGPFSQTRFTGEHKVTVNGDLFFMLSDINCIATFDLESEEWKPDKIEGPLLGHKKKEDKWRITLTELKGTLCMVHNVQHFADLGGHFADIWLLKDPNSSVWVKEYQIQQPESLLLFTRPLEVLGDGTTLLLLNAFWKAGNTKDCHRYILQLYNSGTKAFIDYMEMAPGFSGGMAFYTGSL